MLLYSIILCFCFSLFANDGVTIVAIGDAEQEKITINFRPFKINTALKKDEKKAIKEMESLFTQDFNFYRHLFNLTNLEISGGSDKTKGQSSQSVKLNDKSIDFNISTTIYLKDKALWVKSSSFSAKDQKVIWSIDEKIWINKIRTFTHNKMNGLYKKITGKESVFTSKILFVSDRTGRGNKNYKELYIMDFDGERKERITFKNTLILSPAISPDNSKIVFTSIESRWKKAKDGRPKKIQNLNLYLMDTKTKKKRVISSLKGINSGAVFSEDGEHIYLTLSNQENADIYKMNLKTKKLERITKHFLDDVDPSINFDGSLMTFLSGRSGKAMIYTLDPSGVEKNVKRISFIGRFNASPRFSPDGKEIVFSSWVDKRFDLYKIGSDGANLQRLTKNFGSNEEPWFSPDGQFIVFTSQRVINSKKATQDVYIMNREGEIIKKLTEKFGKIFTPRWFK